MKNFLLSVILTLAVAASLIVVIDRFRGLGPDAKALADVTERLAAVERAVAAIATASPGTKGRGEPSAPAAAPGTKTLADAIRLLEEIEGMILDSERQLRDDLKGIYEKLLLRLEEASLRGAPPANEAEAKAKVRAKLQELGVTVVEDEKMLELKGEIAESNRALEFLMVAPGGRIFESLLVVDAVPSAIKIGLEDLGLVESDPDPESWAFGEKASGVYVYVMWDGIPKPRRAEDLILDQARNDTMVRTRWMFTASRWFTDNRTWERHFAADLYKGVAAITFNYSMECILSCPHPECANENNWFQNANTSPKPGTKVRVLLRTEPHPEWDKIG